MLTNEFIVYLWHKKKVSNAALCTLLPRIRVHATVHVAATFWKLDHVLRVQVHAPNNSGTSACTTIRSMPKNYFPIIFPILPMFVLSGTKNATYFVSCPHIWFLNWGHWSAYHTKIKKSVRFTKHSNSIHEVVTLQILCLSISACTYIRSTLLFSFCLKNGYFDSLEVHAPALQLRVQVHAL